MQIERRRARRGRISIGVKQVNPRGTFLCQADDISLSGILLAKVDDEILRETRKSEERVCMLEFALPGVRTSLVTEGYVVWSKMFQKYCVNAIRFERLGSFQSRLIERYLDGPPHAGPMSPFRVNLIPSV